MTPKLSLPSIIAPNAAKARKPSDPRYPTDFGNNQAPRSNTASCPLNSPMSSSSFLFLTMSIKTTSIPFSTTDVAHAFQDSSSSLLSYLPCGSCCLFSTAAYPQFPPASCRSFGLTTFLATFFSANGWLLSLYSFLCAPSTMVSLPSLLYPFSLLSSFSFVGESRVQYSCLSSVRHLILQVMWDWTRADFETWYTPGAFATCSKRASKQVSIYLLTYVFLRKRACCS
mmetsp:Transcript_20495/g.50262  ORF Transcript_20495/g.50262 Transcript_20495/m.50262 type:complete len:227 (+) Transcript_20495:169-849(+)